MNNRPTFYRLCAKLGAMSKPVMYTFLNKGLGMSLGKAAAQASHAAVESYRISNLKMIDQWYEGGHYTKLVMQADDSEQLKTIERYLNERGFKTSLIIDEGRTEIPAFSVTALGVEIVDKSDLHVQASFESFKTYREDPPAPQPVDLEIAYNTVGVFGHLTRKGERYRKILVGK